MHKLFDHLRHHCRQQDSHHANRHRRQHHRVHQRLHDLVLHVLALFDIVSQPFQHRPQMAGNLTGRHHGAIETVKNLRILPQRLRQRESLQNALPHLSQRRLQAFFLRLPRHRHQRLFKRQRGGQQRRQLPGEQRQIAAAHAAHPTAGEQAG
ncbi:Uncharacterised protein [Acinetobacter baumannii]|nr:Uncharacterised protein [Acinetobacter baumannii]